VASRPDEDFPLTDTGNAEAFTAWFGSVVLRDHRRRRDLVWREHRWVPDADAEVERLAKETIRRRQARAFTEADADKRKAALKWALQSESRQRREAMLALARSERPIADAGDAFDRDQWVLSAANGIINLRTGTLRPGHPDDRITMVAAVPYDPAAAAPLWEQTVLDIFNGDVELVAHVQKAFGYSLTGVTTEQCCWVPHGSGANGKGTLLNTFRDVLGDYGYQMPFASFLGLHKDVATNDLAALDGRRFVLASEVNEGMRFDEARIKALTGCDPITARFLYAEFFEFVPVAKFWLATNHKPVVRDDSHGFWRRIRLVPFTRTFPVNPALADALKAEAPGILAWAVRGCLLWQAEGLAAPSAITAATAAYQRDSDVIGDFLTDVCAVDRDAEIGAADFYRAYAAWAERQGLSERERLTQTMFGRKVSERFQKSRQGRGVTYRGVRLS
jgi:putative DNA primase/helicase